MSRFRKESTASEETGAVREKSGNGWFRNHWCALSLCVIVIMAFLLRTMFAYGISADGDFALSGGLSAQYHLHIIESILNGSHSMIDSAVNYPLGGLNVYPPLVDFIAAGIASVLIATGMGTAEAASAAIAVLNPIIGMLTCIPVYFVGREMFGKRVGVVAAMMFAFLALPISTTVFSSGTEYGLAAFFVAFMSWFAVRMVKTADAEVASRKSILVNALLTGIFLALAALTWNGFRVLIILLVNAMVLQIVINRFNGRDFTDVLLGYIVAILVGILIPAAYYLPAGLWNAVYSGSLMMTVIFIVLSLVFMVVRSKPWIITIPALVVVFMVVITVLAVAAPDLYNALIYGNSPYTNSIMDKLANSHVSMSNVSAYYGWLTMWLPICYAIYSVYVYFKKDHSATRLFITAWMFIMFFASWTSYATAAVVGCVFAVGSAVVVVRVLEKANLKEWAFSIKAAGFPGAFKKLIKPFPFVSVLIVVFLIIVPNVSFAVDAGISNNSNADYYFTGNTQYTIRTGDSYPIGDLWESMEDVPKDGALVSWIDYAYDAVAQGGFDTVVDNTGGGASAVSHMYLAEGAGGSVAAMMLRIMMSYPDTDFSSCFDNQEIYEQVATYIKDTDSARAAIFADPVTYGSVKSNITDENVVYLASINTILKGMSDVQIMNAYDAVCTMSGDIISYVVLDFSMLPLQYGDGSVFSTIAYFGDYSVDNYGAANQFYFYNTYFGYTVYTDALYDTFLWKAMIGPSASEAGYSSSYSYLMALSSSDDSNSSAKAIPGYGLTGYEVVFWQVMYNASNDALVTDDGWEYIDAYEAMASQVEQGGTINYLASIVMLHYTGIPSNSSTIEGKVTSKSAGIEGATVSVYHYNETYGQYVLYSQTRTFAEGVYEVIVPDGDYRLTISIGDVVLYNFTSSNLQMEVDIPATSVKGEVVIGDKVYDAEPMLLQLKGNAQDLDIQINDGTINIDSILPGTYTYTLYNSSGSSIGTGSVTVYPGDNIGFQVLPTTRTITVTVNDVYGNSVLDGVVVTATNQSTGAQFSAVVDNGKAVITAISGQYSINVGNGYVSMHSSIVNINSSNRTITVTAYQSQTVTVNDAPDNLVLIISAGSFSTLSYVYEGRVMFDVPISIGTENMLYTVYGILDHVYHTSYTGGDSVNLEINDINKVSGQLVDSDDGKFGTIQFISVNNEYYTISTDSEGNFTALLPNGIYTVDANNGSNMVYFGSIEIDKDTDMNEINLVDGRRIGYTLRYDRGTNKSDAYLPFVLGMITFKYNGTEYVLYNMTNTNGVVNFYIPDNVESTISLNNVEGTYVNNLYFSCTSMTRTVDAGISNNSSTLTIQVRDFEDEDQEQYVKPVRYTPKYNMEILFNKDDKGKEQFLEAGKTYKLRPGQYTVTIDGSTGYYYSGTMNLYPGTIEFYQIDNVETVVKLNVTNAETDIVSINTDGGNYHRFNGGYYVEVGYKYYLMSTNVSTNDEGNTTSLLAYGYLDLTGEIKFGEYDIDITASHESKQITGTVGTIADGTITIYYQNDDREVKREFDVTDGSYTLTLPANLSSVDVHAEVIATIDSELCYFFADGTLTNLSDGAVRNIMVFSFEAPEDDTDDKLPDFEASITRSQFSAGSAKVIFEITNNTSREMTYLIISGSDLALEEAYSLNVPANSTGTITVRGAYDANRVAPGSDGMTLTIQDINGGESQTLDITNGGDRTGSGYEILTAGSNDNRAANNVISAYQYLFAITFVNNDTYTHQVFVNVSNVPSEWTAAVVDKDGKVIAELGKIFDAYGLQTTVLYVKLMLTSGEDVASIPDIIAQVSIDGGSAQSMQLSAYSVEVSVNDMTVSGGGALDERSGVPGGIWFLITIILLMLIVILWFASKRGVFTCRN